jgi:hypothetical protein
LLDELLLHGVAVLEHVVADTGLGFGVGGGVGVEADGFGGMTVVMAPERTRRAKAISWSVMGSLTIFLGIGGSGSEDLREAMGISAGRGSTLECNKKNPPWRDAWIALFCDRDRV